MDYSIAIKWLKEIDHESPEGYWVGSIPTRITSKLRKADLIEFEVYTENPYRPSEHVVISDFGEEVLKAYKVKERVEQEAREHREILNINLGTDGI